MNNEMIRHTVRILSSDKATINLLTSSPLAASFSTRPFPETVSLDSLFGHPADILLIDEQNPFKMSAIDLCKMIRMKNEEVIMIVLTDQIDIITKVLALELGADDYLEKPVNPLEILARIKLTVKRMKLSEKMALEATEFRFNDLYLDSGRRICVASGNELQLTNYEFLTLLELVRSNGNPVSRVTLLTDIWGLDADDHARPVDNIVRRLRKKLKAGQSPTQISTVWGHGYRVEMP